MHIKERSKDPDNYCHTDLQGSKDLSGNDLRVCLEDALSPFLTEEAAKKLAPVGSSQRNECLDSIIGTKAPKTLHYGDSESVDFRMSPGIAQFNEGYSYITAARNELGITVSNRMQQYVRSMGKKSAQLIRSIRNKKLSRNHVNTRKNAGPEKCILWRHNKGLHSKRYWSSRRLGALQTEH